MKTKIKLVSFFVATIVLGAGAVGVWQWQEHHAQTVRAAMNWTTAPIPSDDFDIVNQSFDLLDANTSVAAYVDTDTGNVMVNRSDDGGETWTRSIVDLAVGPLIEDEATSIDIVDTNTIFVGYTANSNNEIRFAASTDGGLNWTVTTVESTQVRYVFIDAADTNNVSVAYSRESGQFEAMVAVTTDGGASFAITSVYGPDFLANVRDVEMLDTSTIVVLYLSPSGMDTGISTAQSTDGGATFPAVGTVDVTGSFQEHLSFGSSSSSDLAFCYQNITQDQYVAVSSDAGASFNPVVVEATGLVGVRCAMDMLSPNDMSVIYFNGSDDYLAVTTNGGTSWNYHFRGIDNTGMFVRFLSSTDAYMVHSQQTGAVLDTSIDSGAHFFKRYTIEGMNVQYTETAFVHTGNPVVDQNVVFQAQFDELGRDLHVLNTTDGGTTWTDVLVDGGNGDSIGQFPSIWATDENTVFTAYQSNQTGYLTVSTSTDGGNTWTVVDAVNVAFYPNNISIHSLDGTTVHVMYRNDTTAELTYVQSVDGAQTFGAPVVVVAGSDPIQTTVRAVDANTIYATYYDRTSGDLLFVSSTDGGTSWSVPGVIDNDGANPNTELAMDVVDVNTIYLAAYNANAHDVNLYSSFDSGANWLLASVEDGYTNAGAALSIDAYDADRVFISYVDLDTERFHVAYTTNAGLRSFVQIPDQEHVSESLPTSGIHVVSPDIIQATYRHNQRPVMLFATLTNVDDWEQVVVDTSANMGLGSDIVAASVSRVYASYLDETNDMTMFARSTNNGASWTSSVLSSVGTNGPGTSIDAPDANTVFIADTRYEGGGNNNLYFYRSTDGGNTFDTILVDGTDVVGQVVSISAETATDIHIAFHNNVDGFNYVATSTDGGDNWTPVSVAAGNIPTSNSLQSFAPGVVALVYQNAGGTTSVAVSTDGGATWPTVTDVDIFTSISFAAIAVADANTIDVAYSDGSLVFHARSTDGGSSWNSVNVAPNAGISVGAGFGIDVTDTNHVFISFHDTNSADLYLAQTADGGAEWNLTILDQDNHGEYSSVSAFDNEHLYVSAYAPVSQEFRIHRTITAAGPNTAPVVGYTADDLIPAAQVTQSTDASGVVTVTFKVRDDENDAVTLTDFEYSTNSGGAYTPVSIASPALFAGWPDNAGGDYPTGTGFGSSNAFAFRVNTNHPDLGDLNGVDSTTVRFRFKANDGTVDSAFAETEDFVVDNNQPVIFTGVDLTARPTSGDTSVTIDAGLVFDANTGTSAFQVAKNGGAYGNVVNGPSNTVNAVQATTLSRWNYTTVDTLGNLGEGIDSYIATSNKIYILYHDTFVQRLRLALSLDGGDTFTLSDVDTINVGSSVNVAGFGTDTVWATYYDANSGDLKLAYTTDSGDNWAISTIDSIDDVGRGTSLHATSANDLFVSYYDVTNGDLKFGVSTDAGSNWTFSTVDATGDVGRATSLDTVDGINIYIAYEDVTNHDVKLAVSSDSGANFTTSTVVSTDDVGSYLSLESPNATTVYLAFYDATNGDAEFAVSTDSGSSFTPTTIDTVSDVGRFVSMQSNGTTAIFVLYYDYTGRVMKIARSFNGGASFTTSSFDPFPFFGTYAIANVLSDSTVYVPYRGDDNNVVYFKKTFDAGANYSTATSVDIAANIGASVSPVRFLDSDTIVSTYYSYNIGDYIYARSTDAGSSFALSDIETAGNVGGYNELKVIDDLTYVGCYRDQGIGSLRFSKTTDAGATWNTVLVDGAGLQGRQCSITVVNASTYYISAGSDATQTLYFYSSTDGGANWSSVSVDSPGDYTRYTSIGTSNNGATVFIAYHLSSGSFAKFARSTDSGATWSTANIEANAFYTSMVNFNDVVYVGWINLTDKTVRLAKSIDGGVTWSITTADTFPSRATLDSIDGYDANHIFFTYNDRGSNLLKMGQTTDAGASWIMSVVDDTGKPGFTSSVDSFDANTLGVMYQALENNDLRFANSIGQVFDGDDVISKVRVTHQDNFGNSTVNENVALSAALATVRPLIPPAPTVTGLTPTSLNFVINPNASELGDVEYSIRFVSAGPTTQYVQGDSSLGASPFFLTYSGWNTTFGVNVSPIVDGVQYTIDINARNPNGDNVESAYGADVVFPQPQGGGSSNTRLTVNAPTAGIGVAVSDSAIRWNFVDNANNEAGFKLYADGEEQFSVNGEDLSYIEETGLTANTWYDHRQVLAFVGSNQSALSDEVHATATLLPALSLVADGVTKQSIIVRSSVPVPNSTVGQTSLQFERFAAESVPAEQSDWQQGPSFFFGNLQAGKEYFFRVRGRNQLGVQTEWSEAIPLSTLEQDAPAFTFHLQIAASDTGQPSLNRFKPFQKLGGLLSFKNIGVTSATNVLTTLPLPEGLDLVASSLMVDGRKQTPAPDTDAGQSSGHTISGVWGTVMPNTQHVLQFQLAFNIDVLKRISQETSVPLDRVIAQAVDEATFNLQGSLTYNESPDPQYSESVPVTVSTAKSDLDPTPEPVPVVLPPPIPAPTMPVEPAPTVPPSPGQPGTQPTSGCTNSTPTTESSYDGASFSLSVQDCNARLEIVGNAAVYGEQVQFFGTSSEPYTFVTLILNNGVTVIAVSDARGEWRTFVDADQLGLQSGTELIVSIQAMAAKGTVQSEQRPVGKVRLSRAKEGEVVAEFETVVSSTSFLTNVNTMVKKAADVVAQQQPILQTTLAVSAPVVIASSIPLWGYLPYLPTLIYHFIGWILGFLGRRKKKDEDHPTYGVVYDSITKLPLPLAIVRVYNKAEHKLVSTTVTDKLGRYDVLLPPGTYRIEVSKPQYQFPSSIVTSAVDGEFTRIYQDAAGATITEQSSAAPHIPIDPINVHRQWELSFGVRKLWLAFQRMGNHVATPIMIVGFVTALALTYSVPTRAANWIILGLYTITLASQLKLKPKILRAWGVVYDMASDAILPLVTIQLIEPVGSKVVTSRLTDYEGRFTFLPEPGTYVVKASKPGYEQVTEVVQGYRDRQPIPPQVHIQKANERISGDVAMRQT